MSGKYTKQTTFLPGDHRSFNRNGEAFDKGETFSGIDFETGLEAVEELKKTFPGENLALVALRWILSFDAVSCVIPGASNVDQIKSNVSASEIGPLTPVQMDTVKKIYNDGIKGLVHHLW